jgi:23S rRNA (adenine2503-C2)-methyltransferase
MIKLKKTLNDPSGIVSKLIFEDETAIAETVVYKYQNRGVVCFSVQSGCPVGCSFCGTGNHFIRNLKSSEIFAQIDEGLKLIEDKEKIQLMSMSMGEPMLNWAPVALVARECLDNGYSFFVSTVGLRNPEIIAEFMELGLYKKFGLQFSLHAETNLKRQKFLRNKDLHYLSIEDMCSIAGTFKIISGNLPYFNYIVTPKSNADEMPFAIARNFHITCSVKCDTGGFVKARVDLAQKYAEKLLKNGSISVSVFDPAGQDTIGGGCGQLLYVQEKLIQMGVI